MIADVRNRLERALNLQPGGELPTPVYVLDLDRSEYLRSAEDTVRLCMGALALAAGGAGTFVKIGLANPANSGVHIHVKRSWVAMDLSAYASLRAFTDSTRGAGWTNTNPHLRDFRRDKLVAGTIPGTASAGILRSLVDANTFGTTMGRARFAVAFTGIELDVWLDQDQMLHWHLEDDAAGLTVTFEWDEYTIGRYG